MVLISLFLSILVPILSEWIDAIDVCYLDSAVCNQEQRYFFLKALSVCQLSNQQSPKSASKFLDWIVLRDCGLKTLELTNEMLNTQLTLLAGGRRLSRMLFYGIEVDRSIRVIDLYGRSVHTLELQHCNITLHSNFARIASACPNLTHLNVAQSAQVLPALYLCTIRTLIGSNLPYLCDGGWKVSTHCTPTIRMISESSTNDSQLTVAGKLYCLIGLHLKVDGCEYGLVPLANNIEELRVSCVGNYFNSRIVVFAAKSTKLRVLYILPVVYIMAVDMIVDNCPCLEILRLDPHFEPSDSIVRKLFCQCSDLCHYEVNKTTLTPLLLDDLIVGVESLQFGRKAGSPLIVRDIDRPRKRLTVTFDDRSVDRISC